MSAAAACKCHLDSANGEVEIITNNHEVLRCLHRLNQCGYRLAREVYKRLREREHNLLSIDSSFGDECICALLECEVVEPFLLCEELYRHAARIMPGLLVFLARIPDADDDDCHAGILACLTHRFDRRTLLS